MPFPEDFPDLGLPALGIFSPGAETPRDTGVKRPRQAEIPLGGVLNYIQPSYEVLIILIDRNDSQYFIY